MSEDPIVLTLDDFVEMKNNVPPAKHRRSYFSRIDEYSIDGEYLRTWETASEISDNYKIQSSTILSCVKGKTLTVGKLGKIFLREGENIDQRLEAIDALQMSAQKGKAFKVPVWEYTKKGKLVTIYPSISLAATSSGCCIETIKNILSGKRLCTDDGRIFLREKEDVKARLELIRQRRYSECMNRSIDMYSYKGTPNGHFRNASEAAEKFNISVIAILDSCLGITDRCKLNIFLFSGDSIKERLKLIKQRKK
jgi:hypothetical protein